MNFSPPPLFSWGGIQAILTDCLSQFQHVWWSGRRRRKSFCLPLYILHNLGRLYLYVSLSMNPQTLHLHVDSRNSQRSDLVLVALTQKLAHSFYAQINMYVMKCI